MEKLRMWDSGVVMVAGVYQVAAERQGPGAARPAPCEG